MLMLYYSVVLDPRGSQTMFHTISLCMFLFGMNFLDLSISKGSLTLAMGKCLWFSVKIKVCQSFSSP